MARLCRHRFGTRDNAGSACICVILSDPRESALPLYCALAAHTQGWRRNARLRNCAARKPWGMSGGKEVETQMHRAHDGVSAPVSRLLRQQEVETQMHADKPEAALAGPMPGGERHVVIVVVLPAHVLARHAIVVAVQAQDTALGEVEAGLGTACHLAAVPLPPTSEAGRRVAGRRNDSGGGLGTTLSIALRGPPFPRRHALSLRQGPEPASCISGFLLMAEQHRVAAVLTVNPGGPLADHFGVHVNRAGIHPADCPPVTVDVLDGDPDILAEHQVGELLSSAVSVRLAALGRQLGKPDPDLLASIIQKRQSVAVRYADNAPSQLRCAGN